MKIAIYGITCAGKDYLIQKIVAMLNEKKSNSSIHLPGSKILFSLSETNYAKNFFELSDSQKEELRKEYITLIKNKEKEYEYVFADGHYAFIKNNSYQIVFTEEDKVYDVYFYLKPSATDIFERSRKFSNKNSGICVNALEDWMNFELESLSSITKEMDKELIVIDGDINSSLSFFKDYFNYNYNSLNVATYYYNNIVAQLHNNSDTIILVDCDKTLAKQDATLLIWNDLGIDTDTIKQIFKCDKYSIYQFYQIIKLLKYQNRDYDEIFQKIYKKISLSEELINFLNSFSATVICITAGDYSFWKKISQKLNFYCIGHENLNNPFLAITPVIKEKIAQLFKKNGKKIVCFGDSIIDIPMLNIADEAYIICHNKLSEPVKQYFLKTKKSKIKQLPFSCCFYDINK